MGCSPHLKVRVREVVPHEVGALRGVPVRKGDGKQFVNPHKLIHKLVAIRERLFP